VLLAVVFYLIGYAAWVLGLAFFQDTFPSRLYDWVDVMTALVTLLVVAGAWSGRRIVTAVIAAAAAGLWLYQPPGPKPASAIGPVAALVGLAALVAAGQRPPLSWLWLAGALVAGYLLAHLVPSGDVLPLTAGLHVSATIAPYAALGSTVLWSIADARPMAGAALFLTVNFTLASLPIGRGGLPWMLAAACCLVVAIVAIRLLRRQAVP